MKIGIDCRLWSESGVGRYIRNLVENLRLIDKKNEYVLFILTKDRKEILKHLACRQAGVQNDKEQVQNDNVKIVKSDVSWHTLEEQLKFPSIINRENLDLMHFTYISVPIFYNKPFVFTIHDLIPYHFPTGLATTLPLPWYRLKLLSYKFVILQAAKRAKKIITASNATKSEIVDHLKVNSSKVVVTYEGVFNKSKVKSQKSKVQLKIKNYFLYVGNAYPHKNLDRLIKAFSLFCHPELGSGYQSNRDYDRRQDDIKLVLIGKEDYFYKRLKEKVHNMGLERLIVFYKEATDNELSVLYKNALALIIPSLMEGFGLPALEAMANRCLVLASHIPCLKEICADTAVYFDPYDVKDMLKKMVNIYHSNDTYHYSDRIEKGLKRAKDFSWEKMARETLDIYRNAVAY